jgi:pyruvate kinase
VNVAIDIISPAIDLNRPLDAHSDARRGPLTKIVATVGPASSDGATIGKLIQAGVGVFRLNFSHGTLEDHSQRTQTIRDVAAQLGRPIAIMGDLQGPKIRVGQISGDGIDVEPGSTVVFRRGEFVASAPPAGEPILLASTYARLVDDVQPGHRVLINDGAVRLLALAKRRDEIECAVTAGGAGRITSGKGINLPDTHLNVETLSDRDWHHVQWAVTRDLDFLALSFVRTAEDVMKLREGLSEMASRRKPTGSQRGHARDDGDREACLGERQMTADSPLRIIAKIELPTAVQNIESIIQVSDGIMVARGDLGVELDLARVPVIQKQLIAVADAWGKPCIIATQMLESMTRSPAPTRAEANDVATAIVDGADAVMLSGETAVGNYPALAVEYIRRIALATEQYVAALGPTPSPPQKIIESRYRTAALAHGAWTIAQDLQAKFVVVWSQLGGGARHLSQNKFSIPILAISSDDRAARQMQLLRGVTPLRMPVPDNLAHFTRMVDDYLTATGWAEPGDLCILMAGMPIGESGVTNALAIHTIGNPATGFAQC